METTFTKRNSHGANLKRWREWRGIKQEVLADKIGVSQATLSGYEKKTNWNLRFEKVAYSDRGDHGIE